LISVGLLEDIDRVTALVKSGSEEQREWFDGWKRSFVAAADVGDERACEDLADILILFERSELRPPKRFYTLDELADALDIDRREVGLE
jgi:hypothetical protein